jgi:DNA helicase-2/ATP-dependent DNA helicase PcrA
VVDHVIDLSGLRQHYKAEKEGQERLENLDELINAAASFLAEEGRPSRLPANPAAIRWLPSSPTPRSKPASTRPARAQDAVQLMTVHSAKGLEFDVVFIRPGGGPVPAREQHALERDGLEEERR